MSSEELTYTIRRDGAAWLATRSDFVDLQESPSGFGADPVEALIHLLEKEDAAGGAAPDREF
jgi:hypothetical protein